MNFKILFLILIVFVVGFSTCGLFECHKCLQNGDSFDQPYKDKQVVKFNSDSGRIASFNVVETYQPSPKSYCGELGSGSYAYCTGGSSNSLYSTIDSDSLLVTFSCLQPSQSIGEAVRRDAKILNFYAIDDKGISGNTITVNGQTYKNVKLYENADATTIGSCKWFNWSVKNGLIQYAVVNASGVETWSVVK